MYKYLLNKPIALLLLKVTNFLFIMLNIYNQQSNYRFKNIKSNLVICFLFNDKKKSDYIFVRFLKTSFCANNDFLFKTTFNTVKLLLKRFRRCGDNYCLLFYITCNIVFQISDLLQKPMVSFRLNFCHNTAGLIFNTLLYPDIIFHTRC